MENPWTKWRFIAGKIIYTWAIYTMAMLDNQSVESIRIPHWDVWPRPTSTPPGSSTGPAPLLRSHVPIRPTKLAIFVPWTLQQIFQFLRLGKPMENGPMGQNPMEPLGALQKVGGNQVWKVVGVRSVLAHKLILSPSCWVETTWSRQTGPRKKVKQTDFARIKCNILSSPHKQNKLWNMKWTKQ